MIWVFLILVGLLCILFTIICESVVDLLMYYLILIGLFIIVCNSIFQTERVYKLKETIRELNLNIKYKFNSLYNLKFIKFLQKAGPPWSRYAKILLSRLNVKSEDNKSSKLSC